MAATEFAPARFLQHATSTQRAPSQVQDQHQKQDWRTKPALVILNQPVESLDLLQRLWAHTGYRLCADGGANRLYDIFAGLDDAEEQRRKFLPSVIHGDLDSINPDVRAYYETLGVPVTRERDQECTDFGKAIRKIASVTKITTDDVSSASEADDASSSSSYREILVICTLAGRVDQGLRLVYDLLQIQRAARSPTRLWLFSEASVSWVLPPGESRIVLDGSSGVGGKYFTANVGILPAYGPAVISTTGLEWDVTDWPTSVHGALSTSNHVKSKIVTVKTDVDVLFTIELADSLP
ncbi:putative thiamine pyrophosphokinase protein [Lasiodiplodia theobromae]|uniref:Thiamine pyrophosphokinase n=1 Tax=Lasiodiplodia hormozganensis TaxID=869390 RepID=A0AA40CYG6_9PEZI|nr:Thiamine pyrophosphokinase [Lasiodiplodia theobromae]KAF4539415.1 Thiamine pyrophosphokinase [Lasiodiplodia theobromae]KAF9639230.1 putative thiamine pyrophosphokinase protein [Lasiodiplodia theobromae]KAK0653794.1 thiamine pyrophosphokinase 1 [Lasiodiplodia hormozganensis]